MKTNIHNSFRGSVRSFLLPDRLVFGNENGTNANEVRAASADEARRTKKAKEVLEKLNAETIPNEIEKQATLNLSRALTSIEQVGGRNGESYLRLLPDAAKFIPGNFIDDQARLNAMVAADPIIETTQETTRGADGHPEIYAVKTAYSVLGAYIAGLYRTLVTQHKATPYALRYFEQARRNVESPSNQNNPKAKKRIIDEVNEFYDKRIKAEKPTGTAQNKAESGTQEFAEVTQDDTASRQSALAYIDLYLASLGPDFPETDAKVLEAFKYQINDIADDDTGAASERFVVLANFRAAFGEIVQSKTPPGDVASRSPESAATGNGKGVAGKEKVAPTLTDARRVQIMKNYIDRGELHGKVTAEGFKKVFGEGLDNPAKAVAAVKAKQKKWGLKGTHIDGILGPETYNAALAATSGTGEQYAALFMSKTATAEIAVATAPEAEASPPAPAAPSTAPEKPRKRDVYHAEGLAKSIIASSDMKYTFADGRSIQINPNDEITITGITTDGTPEGTKYTIAVKTIIDLSGINRPENVTYGGIASGTDLKLNTSAESDIMRIALGEGKWTDGKNPEQYAGTFLRYPNAKAFAEGRALLIKKGEKWAYLGKGAARNGLQTTGGKIYKLPERTPVAIIKAENNEVQLRLPGGAICVFSKFYLKDISPTPTDVDRIASVPAETAKTVLAAVQSAETAPASYTAADLDLLNTDAPPAAPAATVASAPATTEAPAGTGS